MGIEQRQPWQLDTCTENGKMEEALFLFAGDCLRTSKTASCLMNEGIGVPSCSITAFITSSERPLISSEAFLSFGVFWRFTITSFPPDFTVSIGMLHAGTICRLVPRHMARSASAACCSDACSSSSGRAFSQSRMWSFSRPLQPAETQDRPVRLKPTVSISKSRMYSLLHFGQRSEKLFPWSSARHSLGMPDRTCKLSTFWLQM
mmetsp:Transcript_37356/g.105396  ORF Transcript_37356/g.105396 Transcript_37356/m.105396 type:complete len:204 (+) Transcript_37356:853-1464(+)